MSFFISLSSEVHLGLIYHVAIFSLFSFLLAPSPYSLTTLLLGFRITSSPSLEDGVLFSVPVVPVPGLSGAPSGAPDEPLNDTSGTLSLRGGQDHLVFPRSGQASRLLGSGPLIPEFDPTGDLLRPDVYLPGTLTAEPLQILVTYPFQARQRYPL
jgi:hypothetical protein